MFQFWWRWNGFTMNMCCVPRFAVSSFVPEAPSFSSASASAPGLRVIAAPVASARYSRWRDTANWIIVALLLRVSNDARRPAPAARGLRPDEPLPDHLLDDVPDEPDDAVPVRVSARGEHPVGAEPDEHPTERIGRLS